MTHSFNSHNKEHPSTYFGQDIVHGTHTLRPFVAKWWGDSSAYDQYAEQVQHDVQQPDFSATWRLLTAWMVK